MAEDFDIEALLEAPYNVSTEIKIIPTKETISDTNSI